MNLTVKRCLVGLVVSATMIGIARAQDDESTGTVQLGPQAQSPVSAPADGQPQAPVQSGLPSPMGQPGYPPVPAPGVISLGQPGQPVMPGVQAQPGPAGYGNVFQISRIDQVFTPRYFVDSRGGGLYGYGSGYSTIGAFVPYKLEQNALLFASAMGMVTYDGRGGASVGGGWRYYMEGIDRVAGLSAWFDLDNGHAQPYQQLGLSLESLGRYVDYRVNGYLPISHPDHVLQSDLTQTAVLMGNGIGLLRNNVVEQAYGGFDAEVGGPTPFLGRYGLNAYVGGYQLMGMGVVGGSTTGVSGRLLAQINEDMSFGVQVTNDHLFGLNTQFQVFVNLPNGKPGRWLRNLRVRDRLNQNVFRQYRVLAKTQEYQSFDNAINPGTHQPYFVENINPNLATNGNGTAASPLNSIAAYEALPLALRERVDIILVQPRSDATTTNLDTGANGTLELFNGQRLLSTAIPHTFTTDNFPGVTMTIPAVAGATDPMLFNSTGGNVITLAPGNTRGIEVSGFEIIGSATGSGIVGNNNVAININNNNIHSGLNGVSLTNLTGTFAAGTQAMFVDNNVHDNVGSGIQVTNDGSPPFVPPLDVLVQGNTFATNQGDGLKLVAEAGATIGGLIGGANVAATSTTPAITNTNTFNANGGNGLDLVANGATLNFDQAAIAATKTTLAVPTFGIFNNTFTANTLDGLHIDTTNNSIASFLIQNNNFGLSTGTATGNQQFGIGLLTDSGVTTMLIGGDITTNTDGTTNNPGNLFNFNAVSAINLAASGTATLNYVIDNNTVKNAASSTIPAPHDAFTFSFNGTSGTSPFDITNTSDAGVFITGVTWNLAATQANFFSQAGAPTGVNAGTPIVQPTNGSDLTTGLSAINGTNVLSGTTPLVTQANTSAVADATALGIGSTALLKGGQLSTVLPLDFTNKLFATGTSFTGTSILEQAGGSLPLTSAATANSVLNVTFSNGLTASATVHLDPATSNVAVDGSGSVTGNITPGFGQGSDGIHVIASGASTLNTAVIENNTVTGYGGYGIHIETAGTATATHVLVLDNTVSLNGIGVNAALLPVFSGGGIEISRHDDSTLDATLVGNTITNNFNNGLTLTADGSATGGLNVDISGNTITGNAANGLVISTAGAAVLNFTTVGSDFSRNGTGLASNPNATGTGGDNIALFSAGTSVLNVSLTDVTSNFAAGNGLSGTAGDSSTMNLLVQSTAAGIQNGTGSSFSNNGLNGVLLTSNGTSYMHSSFYNTTFNTNGSNGLAFNRNAASLVRANVVASNLSNNGTNGLFFQGLGSDAVDPTQQFTGTPNTINLIADTLNGNARDGAQTNDFGQSVLVLNALSTTFDNNLQNGLNVNLKPGAQFGYAAGNERSELDNVSLSNNGANGIYLTSDTSSNPTGDAASRTFLLIDSNQGNTVISDNGDAAAANDLDRGNGILAQYIGGDLLTGLPAHDVLITGDTNPSNPNFTTLIQGNKNDGIQFQIGAFANAMLTVEDGVLIGGPTLADRNGGNGINFQTVSQILVSDTSTGLANVNDFNTAGEGTLNVFNSTITNNGLNGINLLGDALSFANGSGGTTNSLNDAWGILTADIENSTITSNLANGVTIELEGRMGGDHTGFEGPATTNSFTFINDVISSNGNNGVFMEMNAGGQFRNDGFGTALFREEKFFNGPTTPASVPLNPANFSAPEWNTGRNAPIPDLSDWMNLSTMQASNLIMYGNMIQFNGTQVPTTPPPVGATLDTTVIGDGVYIRVGTDSYLSADIGGAAGAAGLGNRISGNVHTDLYMESFDAYNVVTKAAFIPPASVNAASVTALSTVFLDDTAQIDMRFNNNTGNSITIVDPFVAFTNNTFNGNLTPNGAVYPFDPAKDFYFLGSQGNSGVPRLVQLFQIDGSGNLDTSNSFVGVTGTPQGITNTFLNAAWNVTTTTPYVLDNPAFPQTFFQNPGNPFLP